MERIIKCNYRDPKFLGIYTYGNFPNSADGIIPGDLIQVRLSKNDYILDPNLKHIYDKDLMVVSDDFHWVKYDPSVICNNYLISITIDNESHISNSIKLTNDELKIMLKIVNGFINKEVDLTVISMETGEYVIDSKRERQKYLKD